MAEKIRRNLFSSCAVLAVVWQPANRTIDSRTAKHAVLTTAPQSEQIDPAFV